MFQRILVPLDGSSRALQALPVAAHLARSVGGSVIVLRVVSPALDFSLPSRFAQTIVEGDLAQAERYVTEMTTSPDLRNVTTGDRRAVWTRRPNYSFDRILLPR